MDRPETGAQLKPRKSIDQMIDELIGREGRYSNNPADSGGVTMWGIVEKTARRHGYTGLMRDLPRTMAQHIYRQEYFIGPGFYKVYALSQAIAEEMFDTGVNMGTSVPTPWLQRTLNALNRQGGDYADIEVDGDIGPATISALRAFLNKRGADGEAVILRALNGLQTARYIELAEKREKDETFLFGWLLNRVVMA